MSSMIKIPAAEAASDPIYAAIQKHRTTVEAYEQAIEMQSDLEDKLPSYRRHSSANAGETTIVETDDPRWIEALKDVDAKGDAMDAAAVAIIDCGPNSVMGARDVLRYMVEHAEHFGEPMGWPVDAEYLLMQSVAKGLARLCT